MIEADRQKIETSLRELASLQADIQALRDVREQLETQVAALTTLSQRTEAERNQTAEQLQQTETARAKATEELRLTKEQRDTLMAELSAIRDRSQQAPKPVSEQQERTTLSQREIQQRDTRIEELKLALDQTQAALTGEKKLTDEGRAEVAVLNQQIAALRDQLSRLTASLDLAKSKNQEQQTQISDLGRRLNLALASKVEELARYRSEFFGRLREVLDRARISGSSATASCSSPKCCSPAHRRPWRKAARSSSPSSPIPCWRLRSASRRASTGSCGWTAIPIRPRSPRPSSRRTGVFRPPARSPSSSSWWSAASPPTGSGSPPASASISRSTPAATRTPSPATGVSR